MPSSPISTKPAQQFAHRLVPTLCTVLGVLFLALGIVGIYLPGVPTTGPLILASCLLGRGNPQLRNNMLNAPLLRGYKHYLDGSAPITWPLRCWALGCMWLMIMSSCWLISFSPSAARFGLPACLVGGLAGTLCILLYRTADLHAKGVDLG